MQFVSESLRTGAATIPRNIVNPRGMRDSDLYRSWPQPSGHTCVAIIVWRNLPLKISEGGSYLPEAQSRWLTRVVRCMRYMKAIFSGIRTWGNVPSTSVMTRIMGCVVDEDSRLSRATGDGLAGPTISGIGTPLTIIERRDAIKSRRIWSRGHVAVVCLGSTKAINLEPPC